MASVAESERTSLRANGVIGAEIRESDHAVHVIEDVLIGVTIAAFALDQRIQRDTLLRVVSTLLEARSQGRAEELIQAAHAEANRLPDWECEVCRESNPGTFDLCWSCGNLHQNKVNCLSSDAEVLLTLDAATLIKHQRNGRKSLPS